MWSCASNNLSCIFPLYLLFFTCIVMQYSVLYALTQILKYYIYVYMFAFGDSRNFCFFLYYPCFIGDNEPVKVTPSTFSRWYIYMISGEPAWAIDSDGFSYFVLVLYDVKMYRPSYLGRWTTNFARAPSLAEHKFAGVLWCHDSTSI